MLGNGVKRKLDDDEDVLEEERRPPSGGVVFQTSSTRQTLLNMSLMKLYGPRPADLRLQRRVLINNVIQRIHRDFRQEGGGVGALFFSSSSTVSEDESFHQPPSSSSASSSSSSSSSFSILSSSMSGLLTDSCLTPPRCWRRIFPYIDTSMYDLGPSGAPPSKMAPMVTADDLVRSMSGFGATGGQNQPFKMDLAELDHIMEVLVGS
ncbi:SERTA domain containing protein 2 [Dissostichus eleginoides]|uniref:SERTA domain containing protein 2 n=1 Tax=Dissostichus eleginoides TaxID=100907 RepID=A0AAD9F2V2_DISEL|nr:SERTA domain containing protein 2 [Dissostichus eleginoides]